MLKKLNPPEAAAESKGRLASSRPEASRQNAQRPSWEGQDKEATGKQHCSLLSSKIWGSSGRLGLAMEALRSTSWSPLFPLSLSLFQGVVWKLAPSLRTFSALFRTFRSSLSRLNKSEFLKLQHTGGVASGVRTCRRPAQALPTFTLQPRPRTSPWKARFGHHATSHGGQQPLPESKALRTAKTNFCGSGLTVFSDRALIDLGRRTWDLGMRIKKNYLGSRKNLFRIKKKFI